MNDSLLNKNSFYEQSSKNAINTTIILENFKHNVFNTNRNNKSKSNFNLEKELKEDKNKKPNSKVNINKKSINKSAVRKRGKFTFFRQHFECSRY